MTEPTHEHADRPGADETPRRRPEKDPLRGSRTSGAWLGVTLLAVLLLVLVIFIAQNTQDVEVSFLGWNGQAPLAVALLIAALVGIAIALVAGTLRILQLRRRVRRGRT
ncbi:lipopolysaccharide assembly protein LapA domain-containing protein [Nocardioides taihuensis]|uniref:Lipopolysaccharide assembly protein LapA domain-containing protein n=1 Tax=Nocardioides taihuensis TaxID=1835606 RepID=A0ABW0BMX9_9ACTN